MPTSRAAWTGSAATATAEDPARRLRGGRRQRRGGASEKRAGSTAWSITTAASPRCRSCSATTPPASIPTGRCRRSRRPTPARAAASALVDVAARDNLTVRQLAQRRRRLWRPRLRRHARDHRRRDGGMAGERRLRRLQRHVPVSCPRGSTISSTRWCRNCRGADFPQRIRGRDAARESGPAAAEKPLL